MSPPTAHHPPALPCPLRMSRTAQRSRISMSAARRKIPCALMSGIWSISPPGNRRRWGGIGLAGTEGGCAALHSRSQPRSGGRHRPGARDSGSTHQSGVAEVPHLPCPFNTQPAHFLLERVSPDAQPAQSVRCAAGVPGPGKGTQGHGPPPCPEIGPSNHKGCSAETARCGRTGLRGVRDRAILQLGWASGGRRRSEIVSLDRQNIGLEEFESTGLVWITLLGTKNTDAGKTPKLVLKGYAARMLVAWIDAAQIADGPLFRRITRTGALGQKLLSAAAVSQIVKRLLIEAGLDPSYASPPQVALGVSDAGGAGWRPPVRCHAPLPASISRAGAEIL